MNIFSVFSKLFSRTDYSNYDYIRGNNNDAYINTIYTDVGSVNTYEDNFYAPLSIIFEDLFLTPSATIYSEDICWPIITYESEPVTIPDGSERGRREVLERGRIEINNDAGILINPLLGFKFIIRYILFVYGFFQTVLNQFK